MSGVWTVAAGSPTSHAMVTGARGAENVTLALTVQGPQQALATWQSNRQLPKSNMNILR